MDYRKYLFQNAKKKTPWHKQLMKWIKIVIYLFFIMCFLWGCGQMFDPNVSSTSEGSFGMTGGSKPGTLFEILFPGDGTKSHFFKDEKEAPFNGITNWADAWNKTKSPFFGIFVYPIAAMLWWFIKIFSGNFQTDRIAAAAIGAMFMTAFIVKSITLIFMWKSQRNQEKMQVMQIKQKEIQAKYKNSTDPQSKQKMQLEIMGLYKKEGIKPLSSFASLFLTMPFLFAMMNVVRSLRILKERTFGSISFAQTPWDGLKEQQWAYLAIILIYIPIQIIQMILPMYLNRKKSKSFTKEAKAAQKKQLIMQLVFVGMFVYFVFSTGSGLAIYWIFTGFLQICQTLLFHTLNKYNKSKKKKG